MLEERPEDALIPPAEIRTSQEILFGGLEGRPGIPPTYARFDEGARGGFGEARSEGFERAGHGIDEDELVEQLRLGVGCLDPGVVGACQLGVWVRCQGGGQGLTGRCPRLNDRCLRSSSFSCYRTRPGCDKAETRKRPSGPPRRPVEVDSVGAG